MLGGMRPMLLALLLVAPALSDEAVLQKRNVFIELYTSQG
jgi:hypothetical protein